MRKNRFLAVLLVFTVFMSFTLIVSAKSTENVTADQEKYILTQQEISKFNEFVSLENGQFTIDKQAKKELSESEYEKLEFNITKNNQIIKALDKNVITLVDPKETATNTSSTYETATTYHEGVNNYQMYWWGARVYLSKSVVNNIGAGIAIATIWIPEAIITKILATEGVILSQCPGGVIIDVNLWLVGWDFISPIDAPMSACSFYGWQ